MASAEQIRALLKSHIDGDEGHFFAVAMQVAAHEARLGHGKVAEELREMIDAAKLRRSEEGGSRKPLVFNQPRGELAQLLEVSFPTARLSGLILREAVRNRLLRVVREQKNLAKIQEHGLTPRRKILLVGPPGTGKTLTAAVLAGELGLPLFQVRLDALITKFMGETAAKLRQVFDAVSARRGLYFFDEFDAIGSQRGLNNDVGEIRRILNSFLMMLEQDASQSIILAATNHPEILDHALFRRFDDVIDYVMPDAHEIELTLRARLLHFTSQEMRWDHLAAIAAGLSYAEIVRAAEDAIKDAIIHDRQHITEDELLSLLDERKALRNGHFIDTT
ncbi:MAG: ATP-binding protein [Magnetococcales bacterium]|nr:ATP-binding protein [Magnetococcales bacterium]